MGSVNNPVNTTINYAYDNAIITPLNVMEATGSSTTINGVEYPDFKSKTNYTANSAGYMMFRVSMLYPHDVKGHNIQFYDITAGEDVNSRVNIYSFYYNSGSWLDVGPFPVQAGHVYQLVLEGIEGSFQIMQNVSKKSRVSHLCFYKG